MKDYSIIELKYFKKYLFLFLFFCPYFGLIPVAYGVILISLLFFLIKFRVLEKNDLFIFLVLLIFIFFKLLQVDFLVLDSILRYYLGIILVYYFFKFLDFKPNIDELIYFLFLVIFLEAVVINSILDPFQYLPNYPKNVFENNISVGHVTKFLGFYQRPYSIGMNSSCTAGVMCSMLFYRRIMINQNLLINKKQIEVLGFLVILLLASGVGLAFYFIYFAYSMKAFSIKGFYRFIFFVFFIFLVYNFGFDIVSDDNILQKVSLGYIEFLKEFKLEQISYVWTFLSEGSNSIFIGYFFLDKSEVIIQSDFAWLDFLQCAGILGLFIYIYFVVNKAYFSSFLPIFFLLISAFHYGGIFTLPGQIILSQILLLKNQLK